MSDNTTLSVPSGTGDTIRDKDRAGVKTQIVGLDINIGGSETLMTVGQKAMAASIPVVLASDQAAIPVSQSGSWSVTVGAGSATIGAVNLAQYTPVSGRLPVDGSGVTQPVSGTVAATQSGTWNIGTVTTVTTLTTCATVTSLSQWAGNAIDTNSGNKSAGTLRVVLATDQPALSNKLLVTADPITFASAQAVTQSGTWTVQPGNTQNTTAWLVTQAPAASGGPSVSRIKAAASTNATNVKASAGQVYGWYLYNNTSSAKFFKLYNKASSPTVGSDTPFATISIPANGGTNIEWALGVPMGTGISYAITGAIGDSDTTATSADDVHGMLLWK